MDKLTDKQKRVYEYIKNAIIDTGFPPSIREMCDALDIRSTSTIHLHLTSLENKGYIKRNKTKNRSIEILESNFYGTQPTTNDKYLDVPILGDITAGIPMFAEEVYEDTFPIPFEYIGNKEVFMLKVRGESMINIGIYGGDLVLCEKDNLARNGDIVVALLDDSATVKTFYKENGYVRLQPENDEYEPIITKDVIILGKVIGLFRSF